MSFIKTDKMDRSIFRGQREINEGIRDLEQQGAERSEAWPPVVQDLWAGMFKAEPEFDQEHAKGPLAKAMSDVMETQEWKNLRHVTKLDEFGSAIGTVSFGKNFLDGLPDEVLKAEEAVNEEQQIQNALAEAGASGEYPESFLRELAEQLSKARGKSCAHVGRPQRNADHFRIEHVADRLRHHIRGARSDFRRLQHRPVAGCQGVGQRAEQGKQRRIPGADDADRALGLEHHPGFGT